MTGGLLTPYRVLDLTDGPAEIASFMLAGLGADVIKVEPPSGATSRRSHPLAEGEPDGLASLAFHAWNAGKRSVALDLGDPSDRADFDALVATADFVIEDAGPQVMSERGLGFDTLRALRPDVVYVAISAFGQDGPHAHHLATDLTIAARAGQVALTGDPDRRPVRITVPQTWLHTAAESALGAMVAHHRRLTTGEAQFVDMAAQPAVFWTGLNAMIRHAIDGNNDERTGTDLRLATIHAALVHECADGEVCMLPTGDTVIGLLPWMLEVGAVDQAWIDQEDWSTHERRRLDGAELVISPEEVLDRLHRFTRSLTKAELFAGAVERGITVMPVSTTADVLNMAHLRGRDYWRTVTLPSGRELRAPGQFVRPHGAPVVWDRPAPALGEHSDEVRAEVAAAAPKPAIEVIGERALPLEGVKIADFSWIGVGPITAKALADHGATVVRLESDDPPDRLRLVGPFTDGEIGINRCQFYGSFNTSKWSMHIDLKHETGNDLAKQMLAWCDIAIDSFAAGAMGRLGLGWGVARELNPELIMVETCLFGQTGPLAPLAGYGYHAAAISGFYEVTGWNDRPPGGPWNAYTDTVAPRFLTTTLLAALDHRRRTGEGLYIEQAQMESALHFLAPQLLETQLTGVMPRRNGNVDRDRFPHDTYRCAGDDEWVAVAVESEAQWSALCHAIDRAAWATDETLTTAEDRRLRADDIDDAISAFTSSRSPRDAMTELQAAGVPAAAVQRSSDCLADPQLAHRGFFHRIEHPEMGEVPYEGHQYRIAGYDHGPRGPAPCLGEHTFEVLTELLGIEVDEAVTILSSGACG